MSSIEVWGLGRPRRPIVRGCGQLVVVGGGRLEGVDHVRIWADAEGESHLERVATERHVTPPQPGVAELWGSDPHAVDRLQFVTVIARDQRPDWHCGPRRQFVVFLDGWVQLTTSDGDSCRLPAGSVVLVEDLHGRGHVTEHELGERHVLVIPLDPLDPQEC
jgi:hypothetical protein